MNDYANDVNALDALLRGDETDNQMYVGIASACITHAVNIKYGMANGDYHVFVSAARDALRQIEDVSSPIASIIADCMYEDVEYMQECITVIRAFC